MAQSLWGWYRRRRLWVRVAIGAQAALLVLAALYVVSRALQYSSAGGDAGVYVPSRANVVVRLRDLAGHLERARKTEAWQVLQRRILRDPALRREINGALRDSGLPTLDDLEDVRKGGLFGEETLLRAAGRDAMAALQVSDSWERARFCVATKIRFTDFCLIPFARWFVPVETVAGRSCLRVRAGGRTVYAAVEGAMVVAGDDRELLADALARRGRAGVASRPVEAQLRFEGSRALEDLRRSIGDAGLFTCVRTETVRALDVRADIVGSALLAEGLLEGAEPARPEPPPAALARLAPAGSSGYLVASGGAREIHDWLKAGSYRSKDLREAVQVLERSGFATGFLPRVGPGVALLTGGEEREGRVYPGVALVFPSPDPQGALEALHRAMQHKELAGGLNQSRFESRPVGNSTLLSWRLPESLQVNDFLRPCYAALPDGVLLANNASFAEAVLRASAEQVGSLQQEPSYRAALRKLEQYRAAPAGVGAAAFLFGPSVRESLDGLLPRIAGQLVDGALDARKLRAEVEAELQRQGGAPSEARIVERFNAARERMRQEKEDALRDNLRVLEALRWISFSAAPADPGISFVVVLELR